MFSLQPDRSLDLLPSNRTPVFAGATDGDNALENSDEKPPADGGATAPIETAPDKSEQPAGPDRQFDYFLIHHEALYDGSYTFRDQKGVGFQQRMAFEYTALQSTTREGTREIEYRFNHVNLALELDGGDPTTFAMWPGRIVIDGTPTYDRESDPDIPVSVLDHLMNEPVVATFDPAGRLADIDQVAFNRRYLSFLNLVEPLRDTWLPAPAATAEAGFSWKLRDPVWLMGDRFQVPATRTFILESVPDMENGPFGVSTHVIARRTKPLGFPVRLGWLAPHSLRYDATGPDVLAPPPNVTVDSVILESTGTYLYRPAWNFPQRVDGFARIRVMMKIPLPDGPLRYDKTVEIARRSTTTAEKIELPTLTPEIKNLLKAEEAGPDIRGDPRPD